MATASTGQASSTSAEQNCCHLFRLQMLIIDGGVGVLRNIFDKKLQHFSLSFSAFLQQKRLKIANLKLKGIITQVQYDQLYPPGGRGPSTTDLDITLITCLLRNFKSFGLNKNFQWDSNPAQCDTSIEADMSRLKMYRNELSHIPSTSEITLTDFKTMWTNIEQVLLRLNLAVTPIPDLQKTIDDYKVKPLDRDEAKRVQKAIDSWQKLEKWVETELKLIKEDTKDIKHSFEMQNVTLKSLAQSIDEINKKASEHYENMQEEFRKVRREISIYLSRQSVPEAFVDPRHYDLYEERLSRGFETDTSIRVNVVGICKQGKTSVTNMLVGKTKVKVQNSSGVEINHCKYIEVNGDVMLFKKTSNRDDTKFANHIENTEKEKVSLTLEDLKALSDCLTSGQSLSNITGNLEIFDIAGEFSYATHTLVHNKRAVYLLVFDLSKPLSTVVKDSAFPMETGDKTMEQVITFWINFIHSYVGSYDASEPPVILVGTHKDKLTGNELQKSKYANAYFERIRKRFEDSLIHNHIQAKYFIVNGADFNDKETVDLRQEIIRIGMKRSIILPAKWRALEKELIQIRYMKIVPFSKIVDIDSQNEFPLKEEKEIKLFLVYHHTKGTLLFIDEEPISAYVVLDIPFLINAFQCIVASERVCQKEPKHQRRLWDILRKQGQLHMELIVWKDRDFYKHSTEILMFMQWHNIISEVSSFDIVTGTSNGLGWFFVPMFLRDHSDNITVIDFLSGKIQTSLRFLMLFQYTPVVQFVYYRLIAALLARWSVILMRRELLLYANIGMFRLDNHNIGIVELQQNRIEMRVISIVQNINSIIADKFRRFAETVVISEFNKLRPSSTIQRKPFQTCFRCNDKSHGLNGGQEILHLETIQGKSIKPCFDMPHDHNIHAKQALSEWFEEFSTIQLSEDCPLSLKYVSKIAQSIGSDWELLGIELGLSVAEINQIKMDFPTNSWRIFEMLLKLIAEQKLNATVNSLLQAMKSIKSLTVDWDQVMNIVEQIESTQLHIF